MRVVDHNISISLS